MPREVPCFENRVWHVFTDGSSEAEANKVGGVLRRRGEAQVRYFSCKVPCELAEAWAGDMKHIIGSVEAYAVLVTMAVWHQFLC